MFRGYGIVSLIILAAFVFINFYRKDVGFQPDLPPEEDPREMAEEGTALAPHGVPANPIPRALSSQKLNEGAADAGYGTYNATNGMLDIPGCYALFHIFSLICNVVTVVIKIVNITNISHI